MGKQRGEKVWKILLKNVLWAFLSVAILLAVWIVFYLKIGNDHFLPSPWSALAAGVKLFADGAFWTAFFGTLGRAFSAFLISFFFGVGLAVIAYLLPWFRKIMGGVTAVLRALPTLAVTLILFLLTSPTRAPVIVGVMALFPMLYHSALNALSSVDGKLLEMCAAYRVPMKKRIVCLYLPTAAPYVLKESAAAIAFSLKLTVSAEILSLTYKSIGGMMQQAQTFEEMPTVFALTIATVLAACLLEGTLSVLAAFVERRVR